MPKKKDHGYTKQHIVPRAYLNGFATPGKGKDKYMIGVRKKTSSIIPLRRIMSATYRTTMTLISLMTRNNGNTTLLTK